MICPPLSPPSLDELRTTNTLLTYEGGVQLRERPRARARSHSLPHAAIAAAVSPSSACGPDTHARTHARTHSLRPRLVSCCPPWPPPLFEAVQYFGCGEEERVGTLSPDCVCSLRNPRCDGTTRRSPSRIDLLNSTLFDALFALAI